MAIFGLLPFEAFDAFSQRVDQPFKGFDALLLSVNGSDGLFEPFAQVLIRLVRLFQLFVFAPQPFAQDCFLGPEALPVLHPSSYCYCSRLCHDPATA